MTTHLLDLSKTGLYATHGTKCGLRLVWHDKETHVRAPISSGNIILVTEDRTKADCRRCKP